jgi:CheY-like chemotaxis protein
MSSSASGRSIVLVVEDEPLIRIMLVDALEDAGFSTLEAADGDHAIRLLEQLAPRVRAIVTDINLPGSTNGILLAKHAKAHWPEVHIVIISGLPRPDQFGIPGGVRFFQKPFNLEEIMQYIREMQD